MEDTMTPKQRALALRNNQKADRLPIVLIHNSVSAKLIGLDMIEANATPENIARREIETYKRYGCDGISVGYGVNSLGAALGSKEKFTEFNTSTIEEYAIFNLDEFQDLNFENSKLEKNDRLKTQVEALTIMHNEVGHEVGTAFNITGPLTSLSSIIDLSKIMRGIVKEKEKLHSVLSIVTECLIGVIEDLAKLNFLSFSINDPVSSGVILSPRMYEEFSLPYTKKIIDKCHELNSACSLHICGDTTSLLHLMVETGADNISLDNMVNLKTAKEKIGDKIRFVGNVDPLSNFLVEDYEQMERAVKRCFTDAYDSPLGWNIATGCDVPYIASLESVQYYMDISRKYSQLPLDEELINS